MTFHYRYRKQIIIGILVFIIIGVVTTFSIYKYLDSNKKTSKIENTEKKSNITKTPKKEEVVEDKNLISVDIKGEVMTPGIYELEENSRVIDVINKAGGLTENANISVINLSKKIKDEMVIIIYSNDQVNNFAKTKEIEKQVIDSCIKEDENALVNDACIEDEKNEITGLININTASKEELMTLPSIGESKADSIIEYRTNNKFETIEDIKNVSGIGDSLFDKIKNYITI